MKDFKDKVVVITGGATGIGNAMAKKFGAEGAKVVISSRRENRLQEAVNELKASGVDAYYKVCDVTNLDDVKALADFAFDMFGHVDVLVNNAGMGGTPGAIVDLSKEAFQQVLDVNVFGMLNGVWAFSKRMMEQETQSMILNVASEAGLYPVSPMMATYTGSKYMNRAITTTLKMEMPEHVQVSCVYPGLVQSEFGGSTEMTQAGMPTDEFINLIWPQIENGELHIVSHPCGKDYFYESTGEIIKAFEKYAPHYEGDKEYDSRWIASQMFK